MRFGGEDGNKKIKSNQTLLDCCQHKQWIQGGSSGVKLKRHWLTSTTAAEMGVSERVDDVSGGGLAALWEGGRWEGVAAGEEGISR